MLRILRFGSARHQRTHTGHRPYLLTDLLTRLVGTGETGRDAGDGRQAHPQVSETRRDAGDVGDARRMAHNPEVAGSNPAPATKARGPFSNREGAFCMCRVHGIVHEASEEGRRGGWAVRRTPRTSFATQAVYNLHSDAAPSHLR